MTVNPAEGLWLLPTRRRLDKLKKFLEAANAMERSTTIVLLVQKAELQELSVEYHDICSRYNCGYYATNAEGMAAKCREHFEANRNYCYDWIGILADDLIPRTPQWDIRLLEHLNGFNFVSPDDGWQAPTRIGGGGIVFSKDWLDAVGYLVPPGITHLFWDDVLETIGRDTGTWTFAPDVLLEHKHAALEAKPIDSTTAKINTFWAADETAYRKWRYADREGASQRLVDLMTGKYGIPRADTDLSNVRLLITAPSPDPFLDAGFTGSVLNTIDLVKRCGGFADFYKLPGCSDIVYGRSVLFTSFVNSDFTHNLQVDADMTFSPMDVVRMIKRNEPFVAVAGPRKGDGEMVFAFTNADERGYTCPARVRGDGLVEVSEVGGAFVLVDRRFVTRMTQTYGEGGLEDLRFQDASGRVHYGLWLPTIRELRYRGEDYAMCRRWVAAAGTVLIDPMVRLGHTGVKTWSGAAIEQIMREQERLAARQVTKQDMVDEAFNAAAQ